MSANWFDKDFYKVLGIAENAAPDQIKRAYRKLARAHHPDRRPGDASAEETMKKISEANDVLSDPKKRSEYDQARKMARGGFRMPQGSSGGGGFNVDVGDLGDVDLGGLFGSLFGGGGRGGGRRRGVAAKGADLEAEARISFQDSMAGVTVAVPVQRDVPCGSCGGSGAQPGSPTPACRACGGAGVVGENQGPFSFQRPCGTCGGAGRVIERPCIACGGEGSMRRTEEVKIRLPAGVEDGARIRARGRGGMAPPGGRPGDLFVRVRAVPHPVFGRSGADLTLDVPLSYAEATLGAEIAVPTLEGPVRLKIPAGTQPGRTFRVKGRGAPKPKGGRGDLLATVRIVVPDSVSGDERQLLEALMAKHNGSIRAHLGV